MEPVSSRGRNHVMTVCIDQEKRTRNEYEGKVAPGERGKDKVIHKPWQYEKEQKGVCVCGRRQGKWW
jgi:hypothetical protein